MKKYNKLEIRLLPMSLGNISNFSILEVQRDYMLGGMEKCGTISGAKYSYPFIGMDTSIGSLVLFQYQGKIIASATFLGIEDFTKKPIKGIYKKAYVFDIDSIRVFEPITKEEMCSIVETFKTFNQSKQKIDYGYINEIMKLIDKKSMLWEERNGMSSKIKPKLINAIKKLVGV